jgi:hypothetical protein
LIVTRADQKAPFTGKESIMKILVLALLGAAVLASPAYAATTRHQRGEAQRQVIILLAQPRVATALPRIEAPYPTMEY